jgi:hypothetical protein
MQVVVREEVSYLLDAKARREHVPSSGRSHNYFAFQAPSSKALAVGKQFKA